MWHWKHILICLFLLTACSQKKSSEKDDVDTTNLPDRSTDNLPTDTNPPADSQTVTAADTVNDTQTDTNNDTAEDSVGDTQTATDTDTASGTESDTQPDTDSGNGSDEDSDVDTGTGSDSAPDTATGDTDSTTSSASDSSTETEALLPCIEVDRARAAVFAPAAVRVTFRVLDCDGYPIRKLTADDVTVVNSLTGEDFNASLSGGGASAPEVADNYGFYTVLALDMSDSIFAAGSQNDVLDSAKLFVQNMVTNAPAQLKHKVAILVFGQTTATEFVQDFTGDSETLNNALDVAVASGARGSTNLYGAFQQAIDAVTSRGTELNLVERTVVILTDDTHETENEENLRIQALLAKNYAVSNFNTNVFSVGIDGSYDESKLSELASRPDYFIKAENAAALSIAFEEVVAGLQAIANSNYVVGVCTPVAEGAPSLMVNVTVDGGSDSAGLSYSAEPLTGDLGACDPATVAPRDVGRT